MEDPSPPSEISSLLARWRDGDRDAMDRLFASGGAPRARRSARRAAVEHRGPALLRWAPFEEAGEVLGLSSRTVKREWRMAAALRGVGQTAEAEALFRQARELFRRKKLTSHARYLELLRELAALLSETGRAADVEPLRREAAELQATAPAGAAPRR